MGARTLAELFQVTGILTDLVDTWPSVTSPPWRRPDLGSFHSTSRRRRLYLALAVYGSIIDGRRIADLRRRVPGGNKPPVLLLGTGGAVIVLGPFQPGLGARATSWPESRGV